MRRGLAAGGGGRAEAADTAAGKRQAAAALAKWVELTDVRPEASDRGSSGDNGEPSLSRRDEGGQDEAAGSSGGAGGEGKGGRQDPSAPPAGAGAAAVVDPGRRCPPLSRGLLERRAQNNTLLLGVLSSAQQDFGLNWVQHLRRLGLRYWLVAAADANTSALLASLEVGDWAGVGGRGRAALACFWQTPAGPR